MLTRRPAAILFDIDGTLIDDAASTLAGLRGLHAAYGKTLGLPFEDLRLRWSHLLDTHFARYLAGEVSIEEQRRARVLELFRSSGVKLSLSEADAVFAIYARHYRESCAAFPDAAPALQALSGYELAVLTNGDLAQQTQKLRAAGLAACFRNIFASSALGFSKPQAAAFLESCAQLKVDPSRCLYVGDNLEIDVRSAASAGLMSVWLHRAPDSAESFGFPRIQSLSELPALLAAQPPRST